MEGRSSRSQTKWNAAAVEAAKTTNDDANLGTRPQKRTRFATKADKTITETVQSTDTMVKANRKAIAEPAPILKVIHSIHVHFVICK